jgi:hypothetical protein
MATSYNNTDGQGDRRLRVSATASASLFNSQATTFAVNSAVGYGRFLLNGNEAENTDYVPTGTGFIGKSITFDFSWSRVIDEITLLTQNAADQGTWQFAGSNDASNWTDLGIPVASGSTATHTMAFTNATAYRYYRMTGSSGTISQSFWREIRFKIESPTADETEPQYYNALGHGARAGSITVTAVSGVFDTTAGASEIVDGSNNTTTRYVPNGTGWHGKSVTFDFGSGVAKRITEVNVMTELGHSQQTWVIAGSNDDAAYTTLGTVAASVMGHRSIYAFTNPDTYRYYRMTGSSGTMVQTYWKDVEFQIANSAESVGGGIGGGSNRKRIQRSGAGPLGFFS